MSYINTEFEGYSGILANSLTDVLFSYTTVPPEENRIARKKSLASFAKPFASFGQVATKIGAIITAPLLFVFYTLYSAGMFVFALVMSLLVLIMEPEKAFNVFKLTLIALVGVVVGALLFLASPLINLFDLLGSGVNNLVYLFKNNTVIIEREMTGELSEIMQDELLNAMKESYSEDDGITYEIQRDVDHNSTKIIMKHIYSLHDEDASLMEARRLNVTELLEKKLDEVRHIAPLKYNEEFDYFLEFTPTKAEENTIKGKLKEAFPNIAISVTHDQDSYADMPTTFHLKNASDFYSGQGFLSRKMTTIIQEIVEPPVASSKIN